jgi:hypothetical protein
MAQTLARFPGSTAQRQQLRLEKVGVIGGFLVGLALAAGVVNGLLVDWGAPDWLAFVGVALTVAATTRLGLSAAAALSQKLAD